MSGHALIAAVLLVAAGSAGAQTTQPADAGRGRTAELKNHARKGDRAYAHHEWEEAVFQLQEALKIAPDDDRLRAKLRRALERRAQAYEARAAHPPPPPPPPPPPMIGRSPRTGIQEMLLRDRPWHAQLKHSALQARIEAEAARPVPDEKKLAQLRRELAAVEAQEAEMAKTIADERAKEAADETERQKDMEKAFEGVQGIGVGPAPKKAP